MNPRIRCRAHQPVRALLLPVVLVLCALPAFGTATGKTKGTAKPKASSIPLDPQAQRLCSALHTFPEERRAQCCSAKPASSLAGECARTLSAALRSNGMKLDAPTLDRCAADSASTFAGCDWVTPLVPPSPESCREAVQGLMPAGKACRTSLECQDGLFCRTGAGGSGACVPPAPAGSACGGAIDSLATFLRQTDLAHRHPECAGYCLAGRCAAFSALGAACLSSRQCAPGQHCGDGVCKEGAMAALGEACTGTSCGPGASCQGGRCAPLKSAGAACTSPFECRGACLIPAGATAGTCGMKCSNWPLPPTQGEEGASPLLPAGADKGGKGTP